VTQHTPVPFRRRIRLRHNKAQWRVLRSPDNFGPEWLAARIAALLPGYPDVSLCVALSGGVDSTALLAALAAGRAKFPRLRALHVDHGLRPASKQWAQHCRSLARRLHVPLKVLTTKVERQRGESLEAAARDARYRLLGGVLHPGEVLLTAHHSDDQLETVLLQLFRGSGLPGIAGMPALAPFAQGWLARPLLSRSRAELEAWARQQDLSWIDDDSNADERLDRNYLRLRVLPLIRERWPGAPTAVSRSARHAAEAQVLLDLLARVDVERACYGELLSVKTLRALPADRRRNALRFWITRAGYLAPDSRRLEEIAGAMLDARPDANPFVEWGDDRSAANNADGGVAESPNAAAPPTRTRVRARNRADADAQQTAGDARRPDDSLQRADAAVPRDRTRVRVQRDGDLLRLSSSMTPILRSAPPPQGRSSSPGQPSSQPSAASAPAEVSWSWRAPGTCTLPHDLGKLELEPDDRGPIDLDALPEILTIRWRGGGERLSPRRGGARRSLKNLLQEAHVPVAERPRVPLLFSVTPDGAQLIAVADLLIDASVQATPATRRRARLRWTRAPIKGAQRR
jgi:tRNA(Ile)-lysidine synthetase-like protein